MIAHGIVVVRLLQEQELLDDARLLRVGGAVGRGTLVPGSARRQSNRLPLGDLERHAPLDRESAGFLAGDTTSWD